MTDQDPKIIVTIPSDEKIVKLINITAKFVAADGEAFEQVINTRLFNFIACYFIIITPVEEKPKS